MTFAAGAREQLARIHGGGALPGRRLPRTRRAAHRTHHEREAQSACSPTDCHWNNLLRRTVPRECAGLYTEEWRPLFAIGNPGTVAGAGSRRRGSRGAETRRDAEGDEGPRRAETPRETSGRDAQRRRGSRKALRGGSKAA